MLGDAANQVNGGQRVATVLMYLSDVEEGKQQHTDAPSKGARQEPARATSSCLLTWVGLDGSDMKSLTVAMHMRTWAGAASGDMSDMVALQPQPVNNGISGGKRPAKEPP